MKRIQHNKTKIFLSFFTFLLWLDTFILEADNQYLLNQQFNHSEKKIFKRSESEPEVCSDLKCESLFEVLLELFL